MRLPLALVLLVGCAGPTDRPIELRFAGEVGGEPFECGRAYAGIGTSGTTLTPSDLRFFVHDVMAITEDGEVRVTLANDGTFSDGDVALVDLETGCGSGDARTNVAIHGTVPAGTGALTGVRFTLGVPADRNHVEAASQAPPLNVTTLFWGWSAGYDFLRTGGTTTGFPRGFEVLVGAMDCSGDYLLGERTCAVPNRPTIELEGDVEAGVIVADLARLYETTDMDRNAGGPPGCMSDEDDPECETIFAALGLRDVEQTFFSLESR
jgi:uncharacterized repeat protein (TIGR04052 family)